MKYLRVAGLLAVVVAAIAVTPVLAATAETIFEKIVVNQIVLKGKNTFIQNKGSKPVTIKDNLKVKGNITLAAGAKVDGKDISAGYDNVIIVAKSGGDFKTISAAMASITDANSGNRYLVWVAPGYYDGTFTMAEYTELRGASRDGVVITGANVTATSAAIVAGTGSIIKDLTVTASGTGDMTGIYVPDGKDLELNNVVAYLSDIEGDYAKTIENNNGTVVVRDSYISSGAAAVSSSSIHTSGNLTVENSRIETTNINTNQEIIGIYVETDGKTISIKDSTSTVIGSNDSTGAASCYAYNERSSNTSTVVENSEFNAGFCTTAVRSVHLQGDGSSIFKAYQSRFLGGDPASVSTYHANFYAAGTLIKSGTSDDTSVVTCVGSFDANFTALSPGCQSII